jgi:regulator of protease activity HflC (stomatin/prohibitin superfamily)
VRASFRLDQTPQAGRLLAIVETTSKTSVITYLIVKIIAAILRKIVGRNSPTITLDELITDNNGRITASRDVTTCTIT